jgi:cysteinyl-tRNA synthetase
MLLFNTESRLLEEVKPIDGKTVKLYTCGPTVYNFAHIGNFRTYVFDDILRKTLRYFGWDVLQVMNITDLDDKTFQGARSQGIPLSEFVAPFKRAFFEDLSALGIEKAEYYPDATAYIPQMIEVIARLLKQGYAYYGVDKNIYYSIHKFPSYGRLSHLDLNSLKVGARVTDEYEKDHAADFVLWKIYDAARDGHIFWESPFGRGRPGWHIECSTMALSLLGESIDIHAGGIDLIFPHHENEIAQSEGCTGKHFAKIWVHSEHLLVDHRKMSKSLGNFYTLRDLLAKGYTGRQVRFLLLSTHYRTPLNFTWQSLQASIASLQRIDDFVERLSTIEEERESFNQVTPLVEEAHGRFISAMREDLNISPALAALFDLIRGVNALIDQKQVGTKDMQEVTTFLQDIDRILGVIFFGKIKKEIPVELLALLQKREVARTEKNWALADECRDLLSERGFLVEDTPQGARLKEKL